MATTIFKIVFVSILLCGFFSYGFSTNHTGPLSPVTEFTASPSILNSTVVEPRIGFRCGSNLYCRRTLFNMACGGYGYDQQELITDLTNEIQGFPQQIHLWVVELKQQTTAIKLDNLEYELLLSLGPIVNNKSKLHVQLVKWKPSKPEDEEFEHCLFTAKLKFTETDVGQDFDLKFGHKITPTIPFTLGDPVTLENPGALRNKIVKVIISKYHLFSHNGECSWRITNFPEIMKTVKEYSSTLLLRGPTFYTSPEGYRVKVELEFKNRMEVKLSFLSGENDHLLPRSFSHISTVVIKNLVHAGKEGHEDVQRCGPHDLSHELSYSYIFDTYEYLVSRGCLQRDAMEIRVWIIPFLPGIKKRTSDFTKAPLQYETSV
ncbi:hypothetical protein CHUAL_010569 [Chamberlinius hualienensis]